MSGSRGTSERGKSGVTEEIWRGRRGRGGERRKTRADKGKGKRKGTNIFVRHLRLAAHGLHPISLFLSNNFANGHSTFVCLASRVLQPSPQAQAFCSGVMFARSVRSRLGEGEREKFCEKRAWKFFFRARVFVALSRRRRYHRRVVKIGDKSLVDSLQKIFSHNVQRVQSVVGEHVVGLIKRTFADRGFVLLR